MQVCNFQLLIICLDEINRCTEQFLLCVYCLFYFQEYYQNIEEKLAAAEAALQAKTAESEEDAKRIEEFHTESGEYRQKLNEVDQENQR